MRISLKLIAMLWVGLFLIIGGLLYSAYSQLKPDTFVALITEQVQKNYPGTQLQVENVSYGFSLDFNLKLKNILLKRADKVISRVGEIELKVPWWLLLTNRGNAQINLSQMDIFVDHEEIPSVVKAESSPSTKSFRVSLPNYLADARFTVRAKDISIRDIDNTRRFFTVSKLLVREFQYGKNSAFELNIPIEINHNSISYTSDLWLFGDVTPEPHVWQLNYRGEFRTTEATDKFQMEDIVIHGKSTLNPNHLAIQSQVELLIEKESIGKGLVNASNDELTVEMDFTRLPMNYFSFVYEEIKNPYLKIREGEAVGAVKFNKSFSNQLASVNGKLSFDGDFQVAESQLIPGKWQISFENSRWEVSFISPKGEASFFRRSVMDIQTNKVVQFNEELGFSGLDLNQTMATIRPLSDFLNELPPPYFVTTISCKKCLQGEKLVNGNFKYGFSPDQKFYQGELYDEVSALKVNFSDKIEQNALDIKFDKFSWYSSYQFLAPYFSAQTAQLSGKIEGRWSGTWESGKWLSQLRAIELSAAQGKIPDFITNTAQLFELESQKAKVQSLNVSVQNNAMKLNSLLLEDLESAKITGSLNSQQKSSLMLTYPKNRRIKPVKKEVIDPYWMNKEEI
ncbi:MAG: hypothetical protein NDI69_05735 [Bacteriovoracaceae bacterium]|nr:hypothetical protein [Bacteriovoracaceae bacterium]